MTKELH